MNNQLWDRIADDLLIAAKVHELEQPQRNNDGETMRRAAAAIEALLALKDEQIALLRDSRTKFASIATGAACDHDGFTYEEIEALATQGAHAIDRAMRVWQPLPAPPADEVAP
jgi:hypothetical protein